MANDFEKFKEQVRVHFGPHFLTEDKADLKEYGKDWTKVYEPDPSAVAFPKSTEEVSKLMKLAYEYNIPVVPSGGRTGLAGGAVAKNKELVVSLTKMRKMGEPDVRSLTLQVEAGVITQAVHQHCEPYGLTWPVDFASKGSSHVAGNIATNAGGIRVLRYGLTRNWVLGLTVVTPDGEVLELNGALEKNNTGLDLRQLFIGTEGTLGIITEAILKLHRLPQKLDTLMFSVESLDHVLQLFEEARRGPFTLMAYEFLTDACLSRVIRNRGFPLPFQNRTDCYVVMEAEEAKDLDSWLERLFDLGIVKEGLLAQNPKQVAEFWAYREGVAESLFATGLPHKNDVAIPINQIAGFCSEMDAFFSSHYPGWEICNFGHIGDGNFHINIMKPDSVSKEEFLQKTHVVDHDLFKLVNKYKGSISAEHGIGLLKKDFLNYSRTQSEIAYFRAIKKIFDPKNLLNPGKIFD